MAENHAGQGFPLWVPVSFRLVFPRSLRENRIREIVTGISPHNGPLDFVERLVGVLPASGRIDRGWVRYNRNNGLTWFGFRWGNRFLPFILKLVRFRILLKFTTKEWNAGKDGKYDSVHDIRQLISTRFSSSDHLSRLFFQLTEAGFTSGELCSCPTIQGDSYFKGENNFWFPSLDFAWMHGLLPFGKDRNGRGCSSSEQTQGILARKSDFNLRIPLLFNRPCSRQGRNSLQATQVPPDPLPQMGSRFASEA